ncbi:MULTISPECIES: LytR/AlgR family response regulator transcription factor [Hymenobacter]|uniref:Response regulator transcription factor n=1 Tax=Hymenobacter jejuensis TaxID=2502781 RepID=A0A5B7ZWX9_9BACT|nr:MULTISPECIES: LytTR family DNA-binding domain-containing protein [Hymenobacter]MBC6988536.1 response regulator transcription factor [Hymenobacter sp. BT491]QDA59115.1 response regulator transcription factor [Hymenobacter jejuensis]
MPTKLSCVIIDDNEINRLTLEHFVEMTETLELVASLADGVQGINYLRQNPPVDLLLLDIEMPHLNGLELVRILPEPLPDIVLVTSHSDFAVTAYELNVTDYLVKPVDYARFNQAISRVSTRRAALQAENATNGWASAGDNRLFVKVNNKLVRIDFDEVLYIEALSTYSILVTPTQKHIVYSTLKAIEDKIPFAHFTRVHRSYMVNTQRIDSIQDNTLQLGAHEVPIGKSYQENFLRKLRSF